MEIIIQFIAGVLAPLSGGLVFTAVIAGLFLGGFYNYKLNLPPETVFHKAVAGWAFIIAIFLYRLATSFSTVVPSFAGWLGIGILWGIFCLFIYIGDKTVIKIFGKRQQNNFTK